MNMGTSGYPTEEDCKAEDEEPRIAEDGQEVWTAEEVKEVMDNMGFEVQVRQSAVDLAIKAEIPYFKVDELLGVANQISLFIMTGSVKPLTEG